jgi:pimeloyl-ACP methyl ester carboxylesterase
VKKRLLGYSVLLLLLYAVHPMLIDKYLNHIAFYPSAGIDIDPDQFGVEVRQVYLRSEDGVRIHAFYIPNSESDQALLFLHGNAGNASHRLPTAVRFAQLGFNVLLIDYQGYGLSEGRPTESGIYADGNAGLDYLHEQGFSDANISLFGRSLGGAVAVDIARNRELSAVILCSTFSSGTDMAKEMGLGLMAWSVGKRFNSVDKIKQLKAPLLSLHGDRDRIIPMRLGEKLFAAATVRKDWKVISGAGHNDIIEVAGVEFWQTVDGFLGQQAPESP